MDELNITFDRFGVNNNSLIIKCSIKRLEYETNELGDVLTIKRR